MYKFGSRFLLCRRTPPSLLITLFGFCFSLRIRLPLLLPFLVLGLFTASGSILLSAFSFAHAPGLLSVLFLQFKQRNALKEMLFCFLFLSTRYFLYPLSTSVHFLLLGARGGFRFHSVLFIIKSRVNVLQLKFCHPRTALRCAFSSYQRYKGHGSAAEYRDMWWSNGVWNVTQVLLT